MEREDDEVCPKLHRKITQCVCETANTNEVKICFDATPQCTIVDDVFIPSTAEFFSNSDSKSDILYKKILESNKSKECINQAFDPANQSTIDIADALKTLPIDLKESLKKTFKSDQLTACFRPVQQKPSSITQVPQTLDWSIYNKTNTTARDTRLLSTSDDCQSDQSSCIESGIEATNLLEGPAIFARKYFTHRQDTVQSDLYIREKTIPTYHETKKLELNYVPIVIRTPKSPSYRPSVERSPKGSSRAQASLHLDSLYSTRSLEDVLIEQHTLRDGFDDINLHEEQAHLDWVSMLRKTFLLLRNDPNATREQLRTIKHRLASGLGREKWNRSEYFPNAQDSNLYDSDFSDSTYSSITVTSYASIFEQHSLSPSRIVLNEPCTNYNFFGDDPPLFHSANSNNNQFNNNEELFTDKSDSQLDSTEFEFLGGNNFMHIKSYGWLELLPNNKTLLLSHIPSYHQMYYEMRNNFILFYYDNKFNLKSRLHKPCKVKQAGWLTNKFNKNYIIKKMNNLKRNEAVYDNNLNLFHFGDSGRGEDVKRLMSKESFTPACAMILKGNYTFEAVTIGKAKLLRINGKTIPLNKILWTRLKENDDDFFPSANFQLPKSIEKTFSRIKFRKKLFKKLIDNVEGMIFNSQNVEFSVMGVSHMEHEDLISKAVSRKRAFKVINHPTGIKVPFFQHLSHFYNCPHLRELSLANIKFDENFDRFIFQTSVKNSPLKMLDYRFRQINDSDLDIIIDYISCSIEWMDLSYNNLISGDKLDSLVQKGSIKYLTLDGNHLPEDIVNKFNETTIVKIKEEEESTNVQNYDKISDSLFYVQMRERFLDKLDLHGIVNRSKIYSGRLATFQWGLVLFGRTKELVLRSDFDKRIPENLLPLHYVYFELRGSYLMWFPSPLNRNAKKIRGESVFNDTFNANVKMTMKNIFHILDCAVVKRAGFKWLKVKAIRPAKSLDKGQINPPVYLYLRGPSDSVTNTWMTFMAKLVAGQLYLNTCDKHSVSPSRAILDHCWQPWSQLLILYGYPNDYESLVTFMSKLRRSLRLKYLNVSNMKFDVNTIHRPFEQVKVVKLDFSFNNFSMADESNWENVIEFCTKDVMAKEFIMDGNPLGDNLGTAKFLYKSITSLTANLIKFNFVDLGDAVGNGLYDLFHNSYDSIGYVKVIELKGHNMTVPVLEKLLAILKERCPNLEQVELTSSISRHVNIANSTIEIVDTEIDKINNCIAPLGVVGKCIHHKRVRKGKRTTRHPNVN